MCSPSPPPPVMSGVRWPTAPGVSSGLATSTWSAASAALEHQVQLGARVRAAVAHAVGHELGDQQGDIGQNVFRDAAAELFADQTTGA